MSLVDEKRDDGAVVIPPVLREARSFLNYGSIANTRSAKFWLTNAFGTGDNHRYHQRPWRRGTMLS